MENNLKNTEPSSFIKWIMDMTSLVKEHGFFTVIKSIFLISISLIIFYFVVNPDKIFKMYEDYARQKHNNAIEYRLKIDPAIRAILRELRLTVGADRSYILEAHNGTSNLNGLPFLFLDMTYEDYGKGVFSISDDYHNLDVNRFNFLTYLADYGYWYGTMEEMAEIDLRLSQRMSSNEAGSVCFISMDGVETHLGFLVIVYHNTHEITIDPKELRNYMRRYSQKISTLLDDYNDDVK